ncbi:hypothetical protein FOA52_014194 [Chlamydomonas sp. UWO 241]|nr:hypothetical protein FOA52_014194 [Chlamydomonas sp. UWO 241]
MSSGLVKRLGAVAPHGGGLRVPLALRQHSLPSCRGGLIVTRAVRGRKPKPKEDEPADADGEAIDGATKKRTRKPALAEVETPLLQQVDTEYLEQLKAKATEEEAQRALNADKEDDPRRFNFHRLLLNAAQRGLVDKAEEVIAQMYESGLEPGPRAFHCLAFAHVRAKAPQEALATARRASDAGFKLLPETYVVLIYAFLNLETGPDVPTAMSLLESLKAQEGVAGGRPGWLMACRELFRKAMPDEAMPLVARGYDDGYTCDADLYKSVINELCKHARMHEYVDGYTCDAELYKSVMSELCKAALTQRALEEMGTMEKLGFTPTPDHYNPIIRAVAAGGDAERARAMIADAARRPGWAPPDVESYNSLLAGMVSSLKPGQLEGEAAKAMEPVFGKLREEMLRYSLRPSPATHARMCEAYVVLGDPDLALGAIESLQAANGTTKLLGRKYLSKLLLMLAKEDRPVDMLNILRAMVQDNLRLPPSATNPLPGDPHGRSIVSSWMESHLDHMRRNRGKSSQEAMMTEAREVQVVDGVRLGMGKAVVDDDGLYISPAKMTLTELQTESEVSGLPVEGLSRGQLVKQVKLRREDLPVFIVEAQATLKATIKREAKVAGVSGGKKRDGKVVQKRFRVIRLRDGKVARVSNVVQEVFQGKGSGHSVERTSGRGGPDEAYGDAEESDRFGGGDEDDLDSIMMSGLDEGVGDILRDEDTTMGDDEAINTDDHDDGMDMVIDHFDARLLNKTAGMAVATELLKLVEMLKGKPSGPDLEMMVTGAVTEASPEAALYLSERLHVLLKLPGYTSEQVAGMYAQLAQVCLDTARIGFADVVLDRAERRSLEVDPVMVAALDKALMGRKRQRDLAQSEMDELLGEGEVLGDSTAQLLNEDDDDEEEQDEDDVFAAFDDDDDEDTPLLGDGRGGASQPGASSLWAATAGAAGASGGTSAAAAVAAATEAALSAVLDPEDAAVLGPAAARQKKAAVAAAAEAALSAVLDPEDAALGPAAARQAARQVLRLMSLAEERVGEGEEGAGGEGHEALDADAAQEAYARYESGELSLFEALGLGSGDGADAAAEQLPTEDEALAESFLAAARGVREAVEDNTDDRSRAEALAEAWFAKHIGDGGSDVGADPRALDAALRAEIAAAIAAAGGNSSDEDDDNLFAFSSPDDLGELIASARLGGSDDDEDEGELVQSDEHEWEDADVDALVEALSDRGGAVAPR